MWFLVPFPSWGHSICVPAEITPSTLNLSRVVTCQLLIALNPRGPALKTAQPEAGSCFKGSSQRPSAVKVSGMTVCIQKKVADPATSQSEGVLQISTPSVFSTSLASPLHPEHLISGILSLLWCFSPYSAKEKFRRFLSFYPSPFFSHSAATFHIGVCYFSDQWCVCIAKASEQNLLLVFLAHSGMA